MKKVFSEEVFSSFPSRSTFAAKNPTSAIIRRELIFLLFYQYFAQLRLSGVDNDGFDYYEDSRSWIDATLDQCGLPTLYPGNPYDWLYLFCASAEEPLDTFRHLMALGVEE